MNEVRSVNSSIVFEERREAKTNSGDEISEKMHQTVIFEVPLFGEVNRGVVTYIMICDIETEDEYISYSKSFIECDRAQAQRMGVYQMDHLGEDGVNQGQVRVRAQPGCAGGC